MVVGMPHLNTAIAASDSGNLGSHVKGIGPEGRTKLHNQLAAASYGGAVQPHHVVAIGNALKKYGSKPSVPFAGRPSILGGKG